MTNTTRKAAVQRLASINQLDKALVISSPLSWVALLGIALIIAITIYWSFTATIPETLTAVGAVSSKHQTNTLYSDVLGRLQSYTVQPGDTVAANQIVCWIQAGSGEILPVYSNQAGIVARTLIAEGEYLGEKNAENETMGKAVVKLDPDPAIKSSQVVVFYVPKDDVGKLRVGMETQVTLTAQQSQTYGHMTGRITNIDSYATTTADLIRLHGSELGLKIENEPVAVTCELRLNDINNPTNSGYWWSNSKGSEKEVVTGDKCNVKVIVKKVHPIEKFITKLQEIWDGQR